MKKAKTLLCTLLALVAVSLSAQDLTVSGTVKDASNGEAIPFASVLVKGTASGVSSDAEGFYSISAPASAVLQFSAIGYEAQEVAINGKSNVDVRLKVDSQFLDETIVVAYGVQKKSSFVGSATQLSGDKLAKMQNTNVSKSLEGAVAGLMTASSSGTPGSSASIQIRGFGSVSASTAPLIVLDGTPYEGSLNSIPAQDIESITVLKDAAANSMYGARGSNGVIMITTKRGTAGKVSITFDAKVGVNSRGVPSYDVISDPGEYYEMTWESLRNAAYYGGILDLAQAGIYASGQMVGSGSSALGPYNIYRGIADNEIVNPGTGKLNAAASALKWNDVWNKDVFRSGIRQEYNLSVTGGSDSTQGYFSASYLNDEGYVPQSGFNRLSVRAKVDQTVGKFIKAGINLSYTNTDQLTYSSSEGSNYSNLFMFTQMIAPIYPIYLYDADGNRQYDAMGSVLYDWGETGRAYASNSNPYGQLLTSDMRTIRDNISARGYINVNILKDLVFSVNVAYDIFNTKSNDYMTPKGGDAKEFNGLGTQTMQRYAALNANQLLTWTPTFGDHSLNILLGHETKSDSSYGLEGQMANFVNPDVSDFANATVYRGLTSSSSGYFLEGFFSRAEYNYANKYYLSASYRRDGSSRFAPDKRRGSFYAVGGSWNAKGESFLRDIPWLDALRAKASYGTQGNDNIGYSRVYEDLYRIDRVNGEASFTQTFRAAPDVTWEKSNNFNAGIEGRIFNKLSFNVEYFIKETKDMIYMGPVIPSLGLPSTQLVNDMDMRNNGVEFELSLDIFKNRNFGWNVALNGTHYKNAITKLPSDYPAEGKQYGNFWRETGSSLYNYYLYEWAGVDPTNGKPQYYAYDEDGDRTIVNTASEATYRKIGKTPIPDLYGGFSTTLNFFGFDFSANFAYQLGGWTLDSVYQTLMTSGNAGSNWHKDIFNRWTPQNTETDVPKVLNNDQQANETSTRWLTSSSYLSLRNVTLGYTLPKSFCQRLSLQNARVYITADNVFYLSARKGMDVRKSFSGGNGFTYSALRTVSGGLTLTF